MKDDEFQKRLEAIIKTADSLPGEMRDKMLQIIEETRKRHQKIKDNGKIIQDSVDHLRVSVKYLVFDLEATRRENEILRRRLRNWGIGDNVD